MSTTLITFEYTTTDTLSTSSSALKADDLDPVSVVKKAGSVWNVSYSLSSVMASVSRINAIYKIFCVYPQDTTNNLTTFLQLRLDFCIQAESYPSYYCPTNIVDYNNLNTNTCSRLVSTNPDFNNLELSNKIQCYGLKQYLDIDSTDETMKSVVQQGYRNFCYNNPTMKECQCYNRVNFEAYKNAISILSTDASMQSGNESCWYIPCQYKTNIQVDPDLQSAYGNVQCPNVCQNIIALVNNKNVSLSDISLSNNCIATSTDSIKESITDNLTNAEATKIYSAEETKSKTTTAPPKSSASTITIDQKTLFIALGGLVLFVIIIFIVNVASGKPNTSVDKKTTS